MQSIFFKTYIKIAALTAVSLIVFVIFLENALYTSDVEDFAAIGSMEAELLVNELRDRPPNQWPEIINSYETHLPISLIETIDSIPNNWQRMARDKELYFNSNEEDAWEIALLIDGTDHYLHMVESTNPITLLDILDSFGLVFGIFLILGLAMFYLSRRIEITVKEFAAGVTAVSAGQLSTRLHKNYEEPFRTLSHDFNAMAERLECLMRDQHIMIGALPHELRTPIARLRFALDITRSADSLPKMRNIVEQADGYLGELESLVEDVLKLSRLQLDGQFEMAETDVFGIISAVIEHQAQYTNIPITPPRRKVFETPLYAEARSLKLAISNLIINTERYARHQITVKAYKSDSNNLIIAIHDDGPGVPLKERDSLFIPFARADKSRTRATGGVGLGLCIVDIIMRGHGGHAYYASSELGGAGFFLEWPAFHTE